MAFLRNTTGLSRRRVSMIASTAALAVVLAACGDGDSNGDDAGADDEVEDVDGGADTEGAEDVDASEEDDSAVDEDADRLHIVATTSILGDVVSQITQGDADVDVLMAPGVDPHAYEPSAQEAAMLREADLVIANGLQLEENLVSALEAAVEDGVNVYEVADDLDPIEFDDDHDHAHDHGDDDDHAHDDDDHAHDDDDHAHDDDDHAHDDDDHAHDDDHHDHDHGPEDPHIWFDPVRMADGARLITDEIAAVDDRVTDDEWADRGEAYAGELMDVHADLESQFEQLDEDDRILVTNHDALGYLADRYDFTVLGTVIPGSSTQVETDPGSFADLVSIIEEYEVTSIFAENTDSTVLADQLASEVVGRSDLEVEVVPLYTDALGDAGSGAETYAELMRTNADRIVDALA